jgi:rhodanese-related sulfurtransferase
MMPIHPKTKRMPDLLPLLQEGAVLLDVRTEEEFVGCHIEGAVNIPLQELDRSLSIVREWKRPVVVYGADDQRSSRAVTKLRNHGITAFDGGSREELLRLIYQ